MSDESTLSGSYSEQSCANSYSILSTDSNSSNENLWFISSNSSKAFKPRPSRPPPPPPISARLKEALLAVPDNFKKFGRPDRMAQPSDDWQPSIVQMKTSMGDISFELYWQHAPKTCRNFAELCRRGYYDGTIFHRVIRDFMVQGGDPTGTGRGGASIYGKSFEDEIHPELKHTGAGILSMANSGPDSNGSQFFVTLGPCQWLDGKHSIFGRVKSGMHVVKRIGSVETDGNDIPVDSVRIVSSIVPLT